MGKVWVLNVDPAVYEQTVQHWLQESILIQFLPHASITQLDPQKEEGEAYIQAVTLQTPDGPIKQEASAVVDVTGQAAVVRLLDAHQVTEDESTELIPLEYGINPVSSGINSVLQNL